MNEKRYVTEIFLHGGYWVEIQGNVTDAIWRYLKDTETPFILIGNEFVCDKDAFHHAVVREVE